MLDKLVDFITLVLNFLNDLFKALGMDVDIDVTMFKGFEL